MAKSIVALVASFIFINAAFSQTDFKSEEELKSQAQKLFEERKLVEASPLFAQLLSLYPQDPNLNYKYGATLLEASADREKPLKYLKFAVSKSSQVDPLAYFFLGKAHHLSYNFADAVKFYSRFKQKADKGLIEEFKVDRQIEMAKNGNKLLSKLNEVQVLDKQVISRKDFFRIYELEGINGKIIVKPEEFMTKYDQKVGEKSVIYLPANASEVYFSSYGKKGENGRDIFKTVKLGNRSWSEPVNLGPSINTPYDENYPFIHPDGRTLYFASKGHSSMGGYDLFMSVYDQSTASWKEPVNLDFAFSSVDDDILFVTDQNKVLAYFASSRANEGDNISVYKVMVEKAPAELSVIKGKFIAESNPDLKDAKITVIDSKTQQTVGIYNTDENGNYQVEIASNGGVYRFNVETTADDPIHTGEVNIPRQDRFEVLGQELRLVGEGDNQTLVIKNIFDGTMAQSSGAGPSISSQTLRQKALLDINFSEDALAELNARRSAEQAKSNAASPGQAGSTNDQLADQQSSTNPNQGEDPSSTNGADKASDGATGGGGVTPGAAAGAAIAGAAGAAGTKDGTKEAALSNRLAELDQDVSDRSTKLEAQTALAYQKSIDLKSEADKTFQEIGVDPNSPSSGKISSGGGELDGTVEDGNQSKEATDGQIGGAEDQGSSMLYTDSEGNPLTEEEKVKLMKAKELASRAAISAALAQKLEARSKEMKELEADYGNERSNIEGLIQSSNYEQAEEGINSFDNKASSVPSGSDYVSRYDKNLSDAINRESASLDEEKRKLESLQTESDRINNAISELESKVAAANESGTPDEEAQKQLDELKLDKEDLDFQLRSAQSRITQKEDEIAALSLEQEEIRSISNDFSTMDPASSSAQIPASAEKDQLISDLKKYRDNDQLAYTSPKSASSNPDLLSPSAIYIGGEFADGSMAALSASGSDTPTEGSQQSSTTSPIPSSSSSSAASIKPIEAIDESYLSDLNSAEAMPDTDLQNARKLEIYDEWIADLDQQKELRRNSLTKIDDPAERERVQEEINQLSREVATKQADREAIRSTIAASSGGAIASRTNDLQDDNGSEAPSTAQLEQDNSSTSVSELSKQEEARSEELAAALGPTDLSEVTSDSPYPQGLDAFKFDKSYSYYANEVDPALKAVKTSLYQAKEYSTKAEAARAAAYTLPTVEERRQAFEDVNEFNEASELLQVQAMKDVGAVNQQEFFRNATILNNLNDYDDSEIESNSLDMAILLQDEADVYFNNAQVVRSEAQASNSSSDQRRKLQKAYDLEMLALNKQRQALEALKLVDSEAELAEEKGDSQFRNAQIQTITDPDILAIEEASEAKAEGDAIIKDAVVLEEEAERLKKSAEVETVGPKRDSLMSLYQSKQDSSIQLRAKAAVYYEREKQIESGFEAAMASDAGILKPALIFTQSYELDTINVDEERKNTIIESKEYKTFSAAARDNQQLRLAARVEYDKAVELRKKQFELDRQAQVILASAAQTNDPTEKERRVKQARVIELKAERLNESIDSLNKIIRVKNYLVTSSEGKMKESIASLSATQQAEIIYIVNQDLDITSTDLNYEELAAQSGTITADQSGGSDLASNDRPAQSGTKLGSDPTAKPISSDQGALNQSKPDSGNAERTVESSGGAPEKVNLSPPIPVTTRPKTSDSGSEAANNAEESAELEKIIRSAPRRPVSIANIDRIPKRMDGPIFVKLGLNESAYDEAKPIPTLAELPEGLVYKVQVGAFRKPIPQDLFKGFAPLSAEPGPNGITRYTAGLFTNEREAVGARDEIRNFGYKDAFVVVFKNGQRVSITSARKATSSTQSAGGTQSSGGGTTQPSPTREVQESFGGNVKNLQSIEDLFFTVQIGVYSKEVKDGVFSAYQDVNAIKLPTGLIRYNSGIFKSLEEATSHKDRISSNIPDAFVVVYYNGKRISLNEAARILNQN